MTKKTNLQTKTKSNNNLMELNPIQLRGTYLKLFGSWFLGVFFVFFEPLFSRGAWNNPTILQFLLLIWIDNLQGLKKLSTKYIIFGPDGLCAPLMVADGSVAGHTFNWLFSFFLFFFLSFRSLLLAHFRNTQKADVLLFLILWPN